MVGVLAAALGWDVGYTPLEDLQQLLLNTLSGHIPGDGTVDPFFSCDLVQLVDVDNAVLCFGYVPVGGLNQPQEYVFNVFAHVAGLGQGGDVADGEGDLQGAGQGFRQ